MNTKEEKIKQFNPSGYSTNTNLFGLPFSEEESEIIIVPVPWEVTVSYASGTGKGPKAIKEASLQVDLFDDFLEDAWKKGIYMIEEPKEWKKLSKEYRKKAEKYINSLTNGEFTEDSEEAKKTLNEIDLACKWIHEQVEAVCEAHINQNKLVGLVGGDHSTPLGLIKALAKKHDNFGVLQIDAHADLRKAYEGFEYSHASISYNFMKLKNISKLVQVGIRDICEEEINFAKKNKKKISIYFDQNIKEEIYNGKTIKSIYDKVINELPEKVYVTIDIDGLDPKYCPNTGTPVPGGLEYSELIYLLKTLANSGKTIIGFDINEVSPGKDEWDANVGARLLYKVANIVAKSQKK
jgi:agmatinase